VREDPIISGGWIKAALVLLVGGALSVGAYLAVSGVHIDLPDLPDVNTTDTGDPSASNLSETTIESGTLGEQNPPSPATPSDPFTTADLASALDKVKAEVGSNLQLTKLVVNDTQTQFIVRRGDGVEAYSVRADSGDLVRQDATISFSGNATIEDFAFALDGVQASSVDRMVSAARKQSGAGDFQPTVLTLERQIPSGSRRLGWTIIAEGGGRNLTYRAAANGGQVEDVAGGGTPIPPAAQEAERLNDCLQAAGADINKVKACFDRFE
jgi:hypothetical protein